jgi:ABC-type glycerol-3-phosphate transport system substrate-binding protein
MAVKKVVYLVFSVVIFILFLGGCAQKREEKKLVIWHWMTDRQSAFEELAKNYEAQRGIKVEFKLFFPPDIYSQKVIAAARAGNLPDIFGILGEKKTLASFIKAGHVINLSPFMQEKNRLWQSRFYPQALQVNSFAGDDIYKVEEGIYGVPIDMMNIQFLYNRSLFKEAGLDPDRPPENFQDFIDYAKLIKDKLDVVGFICGWGETWLLYSLCTEWAINVMGEEKFISTLKGDVPYTDPDWIKVFSLFKEMKESGILAPNIVTIINKESEDYFSKGKAAFSFDGSWAINVFVELSPELDYSFFPLPRASSKFPVKIWGGAGSSFMVNARSAYKKEAIEFLKWLTDIPQQKFLAQATNNLPAVKGCEELLSPRLAELIDDLGSITHPNIWPYQEDSRVIEVMGKGLQQIILGIKTPQSIAKEIQGAKDRVVRGK